MINVCVYVYVFQRILEREREMKANEILYKMTFRIITGYIERSQTLLYVTHKTSNQK